ncbi:hypothetical protein C8R44DRAFT_882688 [Mycena epipterygia]|nr:hypothetical protein C8R44DRAFT_882688 [Mycena epipterygia]
MPVPRCTSSTTNVSDSEPEREACRRTEVRNSSPPDSPSRALPHCTPLSSISNTLLGSEPIGRRSLGTRLSKLEGEMAQIKYDLDVLKGDKRNRTTSSPPSTPPPKCRRTMDNNTAIAETPILRIRSSLMASSPERDEITCYVSEGIQQSLREWHRQNLERDPVAPGPSGMRRKLRRRVHEFM